ncbi:MAG: class I lanthipeptide [Saprospiraceae bacterium]|nr:class I lanthipeptide [Saprospiraceae bacterium]
MKKLVLKKEVVTRLSDDQLRNFIGGAADGPPTWSSCKKYSCNSVPDLPGSCPKKTCMCADG